MLRYTLNRIFSTIPVLIIVSVIVFLIIHITPGDPATVILGAEASPDQIEALREKLGLNRPLFEQFFSWFFDALKGDLGESVYLKEPVTSVFTNYMWPTLSLSVLSQIIAIIIAIPMGILSAVKRGTIIDQGVMSIALLGISVPSFLLGLLFILFISVQLGWLPTSGYQPLAEGFFTHLKYLILPALSLGYMQSALITRMTRSSMIETLSQDFIKTAKSKGLRQSVVVYKHALRNAFVTIIEVIGHSFVTLIAGAVVIEFVFNIPGIGQLVVNSIERRDFVVIQGVILIIAAIYVFGNLIVDLLYGVIDPRVRLNKGSD